MSVIILSKDLGFVPYLLLFYTPLFRPSKRFDFFPSLVERHQLLFSEDEKNCVEIILSGKKELFCPVRKFCLNCFGHSYEKIWLKFEN